MLIDSILHDPSYLVVWIGVGIVSLIMIIKTMQMFRMMSEDGVIEYVKDDWLDRLPHRLNTMKFKGLNRPAYTLICLMYYTIKSAFILVFYALIRVYRFIFWDIWIWLFKTDKKAWFRSLFNEDIEEEDDDEDEYADEEDPVQADNIEELPFCQLFRLGPHMCLLVDHIEMCPDETAFIRVVDDEGYTPLYKRKVRRDKAKNRFIVFNGINHYLDDKKTQPTSIKR